MTAERLLVWYLRLIGVSLLLALGAVVMPFAWMDAAHRGIGLGPMPSEPIVSYLARSTSALCAAYGVILFLAATDVRRYRPLVRLLGWLEIGLGGGLLGIDAAAGLPAWWSVTEGSAMLVSGGVILGLSGRVPEGSSLE